jgi:hypothetical protein
MYTSQIYYVFNNLSRDLDQERRTAEETIDDWAKTLHFTIGEHVKEQKNLLASYYNDRKEVLDKKRAESIDEVYKFYQPYDYNQLNNLMEQCKRLKFELSAAFDYETRPISFILCLTKEHLAQKKKNESNTTKPGYYKSETVVSIQNDKDFVRNKGSSTGAYQDSAFITEQQNA